MRTVFFFAVLATSLGTAGAAAPFWNQFRGPQGDGKTDASGVPLVWSESGDNIRWKTPIHGKGWSSPVVWGNQIWLTTAPPDGTELFAVCVDAESGAVLHDVKVFDNPDPQYCHPTNSYASPTPFVEEGRVYVHYGAHGTACLDTATGKTLWSRRDLPCNHFRGPGSSPVVYEELVFINFDGFDHQYVVALDKQTGRTVWKKDRNIDYGTDNGDRKKAYGTPIVIDVAGRPELISPSAGATITYNPFTGNELWRVQHGGMNAAARPLFSDGLVYIAAGGGSYRLIAVRPDGQGDVTGSHIEWKTSQSVPRRPSQILRDGLYFMIDDSGVASCLNAKTGEQIWRERIGGDYWASPLYADGRIYFFSKDGRTPVIAASRDFQVLAENQLDDGFLASPAVIGNALILRTKTHLYRVEE